MKSDPLFSLYVTFKYMCFSTITKTCLYNVYSLKPHFYTVNLGFAGVYIIVFISANKHKLWVLVRTEAVLTSPHTLCFEQKYEKYPNFYLKILSFGGKILSIFE